MAATALTIAKIVEAGVTYAGAADTTNGNTFDNTNGDVFVLCQNTHATNAETFNFAANGSATPTLPGYGALTKTNPLAISVPAQSIKLVGPFPKLAYNDANNLVTITYSGTGTPLVQAFKADKLTYAGG
jgi:hypothetical protein